VVFMTGLSDTESVVKGFEAGGVDFVPKPIVASELVARIRVHLSNARMAQSARIALDLAGPPLAASDATGRIVWMTPQGSDMLARALARAGMEPAEWRGAARERLALVVNRGAGETEIVSGRGGRLVAAYIGDGAPGEYLFRLSDSS